MNKTFPIVGIGASAGGLEALKKLFTDLPPDGNAAYIVISHLDPEAISMTAEILDRTTDMTVTQATDDCAIDANHVYVIPPKTYLTLSGYTLKIDTITLHHGLRLPIDEFFKSLATEFKRNAVAVILSGTGSDGSAGIEAVSSQGGLVMVQSPETSSYDGMPNSAINTGTVDVVCPMDRLAEHLTNMLRSHLIGISDALPQLKFPETEPAVLGSITTLLQDQTGFDFSNYKTGTLNRRIARRMALYRIPSPEKYLVFLEENPKEPEALFKDLLIGVTDFFRDKEAFKALSKDAIAQLVVRKLPPEQIRVWVPGCATGEEAYSIAMLLVEQLESANNHCEVRVFASDVDEHALETARTGIYPESRMANMSALRLQRFFNKDNNHYRVNNELRDIITFAAQNIIADPPFSKIDLISCRNLLIYLSPATQRSILAVCHFALEEEGFLFLGTSESVSHQQTLFDEVNAKWRIFRRSHLIKPSAGDLALAYRRPTSIERRLRTMERPAQQTHWKGLLQRELLQDFAPAAVLVNTDSEVLYYSGSTMRYLEQPAGMPTQNLLHMIRHELREKVRSALQQAHTSSTPVNVTNAVFMRGNRPIKVKVIIKRVSTPDVREPLLLVTFEDQLVPAANPVRHADEPALDEMSSEDTSIIQHLRQELDTSQEQMRSVLDSHESANEELQASNEEVMSINEELQSSNEELESSKEEMQSMNEELLTMNTQLQENVQDLAESNDSFSNFVNGAEIATLFLDREFRIGRFTQAARRLLNLIDTDVGRPISDIRLRVADPKLLADAKSVQEKLKSIETEITGDDEQTYIRRILPYRTIDDRITGTIITFIDITARRRAEAQTRLYATVVRDSNDAITIHDMDGNITAWNSGAQRMYGWSEQQALAMNIIDIVPDDERKKFAKLIATLHAGTNVSSFEARRITSTGRVLDVWITITPVVDDNNKTCGFAATERDITQRKAQEKVVSDAWKSESDIAERSRFLAIASHDLRQPMQSLGLLNSAMLKTNNDPEAQRILKIQQATLVDMRWLLDALLDTSNLDAGAITVNKQNVGVFPLMERLHAELAGEARQKGLEFSISATDSIAYTDPGLLAQMIRNLVGNAIRYTKQGSVKLAWEPGDNDLLFSVSDTGIGIPEEQRPFIFNEFHQVPQDESAEKQGLGLGLAIVARIAKLLDIQVELESEVDRGSTFSFRIPAAIFQTGSDGTDTAETAGLAETAETTATPDTVSSSEIATPPAPDDTPAPPEPVTNDAKILLIDDEPSVLDATQLRLSLEGFQISPAQTPEQALAAIEQFTPDLIITDQMLGHKLTGVNLVRKLRDILGQPIPAIVVTGDTSLSADQINLECSQLMRKPLRAEELLVVIHQSLES